MWRAGHENREGKIPDPKVQKVWDACVSIIFACVLHYWILGMSYCQYICFCCAFQEVLSDSASQGEIDVSGRQDVLARAMLAHERPGRVRGVGFGVGLGDYFPKEPRNKCKDLDKQKQQWMEKMIASLVKRVSQCESKINLDPEFEAEPCMPPPPGTSVKDSHTPPPMLIPMVTYYLCACYSYVTIIIL